MFGYRFFGPALLPPSRRRRAQLLTFPAAPRGLAEGQPPARGFASARTRDGGEGPGGAATALPGDETPAEELDLGVCNLGLHFPGGPARARKCCEPISE